MRHYPVHVILGFCVFSVTHRATVAQHNSIWRGWIRVRLLNRLIFFFLLVSIYIYAIWKQTGKFEVAEKGSSAKTLQLEPLLVHSPTPSICMHDTFQQYWEGKRGTSWQPQASLTYCTHLLGLNMELAHQHPLFGLFQGGFLFCFEFGELILMLHVNSTSVYNVCPGEESGGWFAQLPWRSCGRDFHWGCPSPGDASGPYS